MNKRINKRIIKYFSGTTRIDSWKSNGISVKGFENITKSSINFAPTFGDHHLLPDVNFDRYCVIKNNVYIPDKVMNLYISYKLPLWLRNLSKGFALDNCLFRSVKLTKNVDPDKYKYTSHAIGFDSHSVFIYRWKHGKKCHYFWSCYELIWAC